MTMMGYVTEDAFFKNIINKSRVGRLATVDLECKPHLIPAVFVFDNDCNCYFIPYSCDHQFLLSNLWLELLSVLSTVYLEK